MIEGINLVVYPVKDLEQAKALYTAGLGVEPYVDSPYYVGYKVGDQEIGLDPNAPTPGSGPLVYWSVPDLEAAVQALVDAGATVTQEPKQVGPGRRIAHLTEKAGNTVSLMQG